MSDESFLFRWRAAVLSGDCDLSANARLVALAVSMRMNSEGGSAFPGGTELVERTGLSLRTIRRSEVEAVAKGWLVVIERGGSLRGGQRKATHYMAQLSPTGATQSPVSEGHRCHTRHGPVPNATGTGVTVAHQEVINSYMKKTAFSAREFVDKYGDVNFEQTFAERLGWPGAPEDSDATLALWRELHPQPKEIP
jgi:hypothetical protein